MNNEISYCWVRTSAKASLFLIHLNFGYLGFQRLLALSTAHGVLLILTKTKI